MSSATPSEPSRRSRTHTAIAVYMVLVHGLAASSLWLPWPPSALPMVSQRAPEPQPETRAA